MQPVLYTIPDFALIQLPRFDREGNKWLGSIHDLPHVHLPCRGDEGAVWCEYARVGYAYHYGAQATHGHYQYHFTSACLLFDDNVNAQPCNRPNALGAHCVLLRRLARE